MRKLVLFFTICLATLSLASGSPFTLSLKRGWQFRQADTGRWMKASVPGTVYTDLMSNRRIPDPFYRGNELKVQWVSKQEWDYRATVHLRQGQLNNKHLALQFDGLDTYADVYINGKLVLSTDNMFRTWRVEAKPYLHVGGNEVFIHFYSVEKRTDSLARAALPLIRPSENNRIYVRKAQYHFGWDWAPRIITSGVWRNVYLMGYDKEPAEDEGWKKKLHNLELVQDADSVGQSFYFKIDGKPTFMKGANWIPADVFLPRVTKSKYRKLLLAAKEAHFNMLRVWGGGTYEDDAFYDLCDSLGIMVWQDFMFAGAIYPADAHFIENVKQEVIDNIRRLRHHKCIVLWCGNNEIDEAWHNWGWQEQFHLSDADSAKMWQDYKHLFEELLPQLVKEHDGTRPYIATSPMHGWGRKESMTEGDSHYWGVWWGLESIEKYKEKVPRFMSEYGMQAMPDWETIQQYSKPEDWDTSSIVMKVHQKHPTGYKTLANYLAQNGYHPTNFKGFAAATQDVQSHALATAVSAHMNATPYCMGTLFWQFNDCWPVSSWSVIDYYGRKKKAYYTVRDLYRRGTKR